MLRPTFWLELDHRSQVSLESVQVNGQEQLVESARGTPAILFALEQVTRTVLPSLQRGIDQLRLEFKNPKDAPEAVFRVWVGEYHDVQEKADELGTGAP